MRLCQLSVCSLVEPPSRLTHPVVVAFLCAVFPHPVNGYVHTSVIKTNLKTDLSVWLNIHRDWNSPVLRVPPQGLALLGPHLAPFGTMSMFLLLSSSTASLHSMPKTVYSARLPVIDSPPPPQNIDPHLRFLSEKKWIKRIRNKDQGHLVPQYRSVKFGCLLEPGEPLQVDRPLIQPVRISSNTPSVSSTSNAAFSWMEGRQEVLTVECSGWSRICFCHSWHLLPLVCSGQNTGRIQQRRLAEENL